MIRITTIRVNFRLKAERELHEKAMRALEIFSKGCPAYQSIKDSIDVSWTVSLEDA